jgi:diguanylate cyclase (GGDEF)-like protein/PAS domain S-box-containing protein
MKSRPARILVVDDDDFSRDFLTRRLARMEFEVLQASGGRQALEILERETIDLVLLDIEMPGFDGVQVLKQLREKHSRIELPIIMVTAFSDTTDVIKALELGANDYLTKPVDFMVATARIRTQILTKRADEARRESEERYALAIAGSNDGIWDWNLKTGEIFYSSRWKSMIGYADSEITGKPDEWMSRVHPEDLVRVRSDIAAHLQGTDPCFENEHRILHRDGTYRWVLSRGLAVLDREGKPCRMAGSQTDITSGKVSDPLTGLPNRLLFTDRLERLSERARRHPDHLFAVMFMDLDRFKLINDSLGHVAGDQLLIALAGRLEQNLRSTDTASHWAEPYTLARLGGDEFSIILDGISQPLDAIHVGERLIQALEAPFVIAGNEICINISIGVALSSSEFDKPADLLRDADTAMYRAKTLGGGRVEVFDTQMHAAACARAHLETELRHAVDRLEFHNCYQTIVSLKTGELCGFEALVRWNHPYRGVVLPDEFISVAEETGLILPMGRQVLWEACRQVRSWHQRYPVSQLSVSVNISARQFGQPGLIDLIGQALEDSNLDPARLKIEITENILISNPEAAKATLNELKAIGVRVGIDDFGTGYSSLSYLREFSFDALKIDCSFVKEMEHEAGKLEIVRTIVSLGHNLGMEIIAEGVETAEQFELLCSLDCEFAQGYFFSRPLDPPAAGDLIAANPVWKARTLATGG